MIDDDIVHLWTGEHGGHPTSDGWKGQGIDCEFYSLCSGWLPVDPTNGNIDLRKVNCDACIFLAWLEGRD